MSPKSRLLELSARSSQRLVRIWTANVAVANEAAYLAFAHGRSLPMFLSQPGCEGVHFLRLDDSRQAVVTLWVDDAAIQACEWSSNYRQAAADLMATGMIEGDTSVTVMGISSPALDVFSALLQQRPSPWCAVAA